MLRYQWFLYPEAGSASSQPVAVSDVQGRRGEDNLQAPAVLALVNKRNRAPRSKRYARAPNTSSSR
jgi:hypothetical protein